MSYDELGHDDVWGENECGSAAANQESGPSNVPVVKGPSQDKSGRGPDAARRHFSTGKPIRVQTPACDRCSLGVMDADNPHLYGECGCRCHRPRPDFDPRIDYPERYTDGRPV